jgi:hypothetical protein
VRSDSLAKSLEKRPPIIRMKGVQESALFQRLPENLLERAGAERVTTRARKEQAPMIIEFENQVGRIANDCGVPGLGIAQFSSLLVELMSELAEFVNELRPAFFLVAAQRVTSRWEAS